MGETKEAEIKKLEREVIKLHKKGLHSVTIAARTGFRAVDVREIIKEENDRETARMIKRKYVCGVHISGEEIIEKDEKAAKRKFIDIIETDNVTCYEII